MSTSRPIGTVYTVGHSNTPDYVLIAKLASQQVRALVDVRRYPSSRYNPQFNGPVLAATLLEHDISYRHAEALGGHREPNPESPHRGIEHEGLRAYADYMSTVAFREALDDLIRRAADEPTALMCAEAEPENCHRRFLSDSLVHRGLDVIHITSPSDSRPHQLHPLARIREDGVLEYPDPADAQLTLF